MVTENTSQLPAKQSSPDDVNQPVPHAQVTQFKIAGDVVRQTMQILPDDQAQEVWWFSNYCRKNNFNKPQLARQLKKQDGSFYTANSIIQALTGKRTRDGNSIELMVDAMRKLRKIEELRESQQSSGYVHTRLCREIWKRCRKALLRNRITFIFGDSQIGKTEALKEYQRQHNHGETIYMEMPSGANLGSFLMELAVKLGIPQSLKQSELRRRIIAAFDKNMLLIVDEAHRCFASRYGTSGLAPFDFLRQLWNQAKCGIVISLTNEGRDDLIKGKHAKMLEQLWRRRITPLQLPDYPPEDDLALFADRFGLEPAPDKSVQVKMEAVNDSGKSYQKSITMNPYELQSEQVKQEGLGVWISILEDAADMAAEQKRPLTWGAVIKAYCLSQAEAEMIQ